jgi:recombination protein RecR
MQPLSDGPGRRRARHPGLRVSAATSTRSPPARSAPIPRRDAGLICVVEDVGDLWAMERGRDLLRAATTCWAGSLSALDGIGPGRAQHRVALVKRVAAGGVREVIMATNATVDGQTTAHYLAERLSRARTCR